MARMRIYFLMNTILYNKRPINCIGGSCFGAIEIVLTYYRKICSLSDIALNLACVTKNNMQFCISLGNIFLKCYKVLCSPSCHIRNPVHSLRRWKQPYAIQANIFTFKLTYCQGITWKNYDWFISNKYSYLSIYYRSGPQFTRINIYIFDGNNFLRIQCIVLPHRHDNHWFCWASPISILSECSVVCTCVDLIECILSHFGHNAYQLIYRRNKLSVMHLLAELLDSFVEIYAKLHCHQCRWSY